MDEDATGYGGRPRPSHIVLDGDTALPQKGHSQMETQLSPMERGTAASPTFRPILLWHSRPSQPLLNSCLNYISPLSRCYFVRCFSVVSTDALSSSSPVTSTFVRHITERGSSSTPVSSSRVVVASTASHDASPHRLLHKYIHSTMFSLLWVDACFLANVNSLYAIARPSVVCNVRAPYSGGSDFRQYFYGIRYLGHPWTSTKNFTEIVPGEPLCRGVKDEG